jgi:hypothetical protein
MLLRGGISRVIVPVRNESDATHRAIGEGRVPCCRANDRPGPPSLTLPTASRRAGPALGPRLLSDE